MFTLEDFEKELNDIEYFTCFTHTSFIQKHLMEELFIKQRTTIKFCKRKIRKRSYN